MLATFVLIPASVSGNLISSNQIITSRPLANITITGEGQVLTVKTTAANVKEVLDQYKVPYGALDRVEPSLNQEINGGSLNISITKALPVLILDENMPLKTFSGYGEPKDIFAQHGIKLAPEDTIETSLVTDFAVDGWIGQKIQIRRAPMIVVSVDKSRLELKSWGKTVKDVLAEKGIVLGDKDKVLPSPDQVVTNGLEAEVIRVAESVVKKNVSILRDTEYQSDPQAHKGEEKLIDEGTDGVREETYKVTFENGKIVSQRLISSAVTRAAKPRIVKKGIKPYIREDFWAWIVDASRKYGISAEEMDCVAKAESNYSPDADETQPYVGIYQWEATSWAYYAPKAGFSGAAKERYNPKAQIYTTAYRVKHGGSRWQPWPYTAKYKCGLM